MPEVTVYDSAGRNKWTEVCAVYQSDGAPDDDPNVVVLAKFLDWKEAKEYATTRASKVVGCNYVVR